MLMLIGLIALPIGAAFVLAGEGGDGVGASLAALGPDFLSLWGEGGASLTNFLIIIGYLAIGLGFLGSPQVFVRFISIRNEDEIRKGRWVAIFFTILTDGGAVLAGMMGHALLVGAGGDFAGILGASGERVLPEMVDFIFPATILGIYIAAVLAATMSTIDSLLLVASSALTRDVYQQMLHPEVRQETLTGMSRYLTLGLAVVALCTALTVSVVSPNRTVFWYAIFGWSGIAVLPAIPVRPAIAVCAPI